jgi:protein-tyrosine phosphatase
MLSGGYIPIIAHPERYFCIHEAPNHLYEWRKMGALAQMNKESILGRLGRHTAEAAELLLKHNLVNCLASDAHHAHARTTDMAVLNRYLERNFSQGYRDMLMKDNPRAVLEGRALNMVGSFRAV